MCQVKQPVLSLATAHRFSRLRGVTSMAVSPVPMSTNANVTRGRPLNSGTDDSHWGGFPSSSI